MYTDSEEKVGVQLDPNGSFHCNSVNIDQANKDLCSVDVIEVADEIYIDPEDEARVVRKLDWNVLPILCLFYFLAALDRNNLGNAGPAGFTKALNMTQPQFSNAISFFFITYIIFELPGTLLLRIIKPSRLLTIGVVGWSLVCLGVTFVKSYEALLACRLLMGAFESFFFPCLSVLISSIIYKRDEMPIRMAIILSMAAFSGCVGGLISYGFLQINTPVLAGFRFIFLFEALLTIVVSPIIIFWLPDDLTKAKFFNEKERKIMILREKQREKFMGNPKFEWKEVFAAFKEPRTYFGFIIQFCQDLILYGGSTFFPSILKLGLGFEKLQAQYLTIPPYVVSGISVIVFSYYSDKLNLRAPFIIGTNFVGIVGYIILLTVHNDWVKYFALFLVSVPLYVGPGINIAWTGNNFAPYYRRTTAIGMNQTIGNLSGVVSGQVYRKSPYILGHAFSLGCLVVSNICVVLNVWRLKYLQREKDIIISEGTIDTRSKRTGDYSLDFNYCY